MSRLELARKVAFALAAAGVLAASGQSFYAHRHLREPVVLGPGVTAVRHRVFLLGSFLGYLPSNAMVAMIGSGLGKHSLARSMGQITIAMLGLGIASLVVWHLRRKLMGADKSSH